ncbi:hypothetical protein CRUP_000273 [Coryphaenoides rupestris]|nr:hypothetical protein CRUP_000273 [Coryphaenoides rupestris]
MAEEEADGSDVLMAPRGDREERSGRYPYCVVWTPIPVLSWLLPIIGHMGICTSSGVIRDFAGSYYVSEDNMGFGRPTKYWQLDVDKLCGSGASAWDKAVFDASEEYKCRPHNLCCDNCHSHVAMALNLMHYDNSSSWNMVNLCLLSLIHGKYCSAATSTVECVSTDLQSVPLSIPGYARTLLITGNHIHQLGPHSFPQLENVTNICLSNNRITAVGSGSFSSMTRLRSLDLSRNPLALIHPEALSIPGGSLQELNLSRSLYNSSSLTDLAIALRWGSLGDLRRLDLSGNRLGLLAPGTFSYLPDLSHLLLPNNSLASVSNGTFSGLHRLEMLDLRHNAFRMFRVEALEEFGRLGNARLLLGHNPYLCSCDSHGFAAWLNSSAGGGRVADSDGVRCASPSGLRDAPLRGAGGRAAGCQDGPADGEAGAAAAELSLQTSYVFLGLVLGFVGMVFLFVLYLNRKGMKKWITDTRDACRDVLEGYHYRYEIDSDPRLGRLAAGSGGAGRGGHFGSVPLPQRPAPDTCEGVQMPSDTQVTSSSPGS